MKSIYAAPLQGFTEAAWRNAHEQVFGGISAYYTPFVRLEKGEVRNKDKKEVSSGRNTVTNLIPQVVSAVPEELETLINFLSESGYGEVNLNMGCPFPLIANRGRGSGLLPYPEQVRALLEVMARYTEITFTVKMRLGWNDPAEWQKILPILSQSCVKQIILHPRIGKQQYRGAVNMEEFRAFYERCELPLVYNGDLCTRAEVSALLEKYPRLDGVMLGRGLLADPSLAIGIREGDLMKREALYAKVWEMQKCIEASYARWIEGGESQLLQKLKSQWEYLLPDLEKKMRKQILKSRGLTEYCRNVSLALRGF